MLEMLWRRADVWSTHLLLAEQEPRGWVAWLGPAMMPVSFEEIPAI